MGLWGRASRRWRDRRQPLDDFPRKGSVKARASSNEQAEELADVLRKHGLAAAVSKPHGREVEVLEVDPTSRRALVRAVEMWLMLDSTPDELPVRCGRRRLVVKRPRPEEEAEDEIAELGLAAGDSH